MGLLAVPTRPEEETLARPRGRPGAVEARRAVLVVVEGEAQEPSWEVAEDSMLIGRDAACAISLDDQTASRRHARVTRMAAPDGSASVRVIIEDLDSTNGTLVNGEPVVGPRELQEHDRVRVGTTVLALILRDSEELAAERRLRDLATRDGLTALMNRAAFDTQLDREIERARRYGRPLSLVLFDVDHFKRVNDRFGHVAGDRVLAAVGAETRRCVRTCDHAARYGGEEFAVILPETDADGAWRTAERLREGVASLALVHGGERMAVTISAGCATLQGRHPDALALVHDADNGLYSAKRSGRNRTEVVGAAAG